MLQGFLELLLDILETNIVLGDCWHSNDSLTKGRGVRGAKCELEVVHRDANSASTVSIVPQICCMTASEQRATTLEPT